ncbi:hypothetical protein [Hydrocarboniphaga effusa]|uniref:hypothetical protein n=1 Tax=Hydrocarboniphaga effusa TaxID=243629 RepID=UPI00398BF5BC
MLLGRPLANQFGGAEDAYLALDRQPCGQHAALHGNPAACGLQLGGAARSIAFMVPGDEPGRCSGAYHHKRKPIDVSAAAVRLWQESLALSRKAGLTLAGREQARENSFLARTYR